MVTAWSGSLSANSGREGERGKEGEWMKLRGTARVEPWWLTVFTVVWDHLPRTPPPPTYAETPKKTVSATVTSHPDRWRVHISQLVSLRATSRQYESSSRQWQRGLELWVSGENNQRPTPKLSYQWLIFVWSSTWCLVSYIIPYPVIYSCSNS